MPIASPFHSRTAPRCKSQEWRNWAGYLAAVTYEPTHDREYYAIRNAAALFDVTPLYKYEITGPQATIVVDRIITRNAAKCPVGRVLYTPWCDEAGKIIDDGTVSKLSDSHYRLTAADPNLLWFDDCAYGLEAQVRDISSELATLALQGPNSRAILQRLAPHAGLDTLRFFALTDTALAGVPATVTRTGYTGDLGYELWVSRENAAALWDVVMAAGADFGLQPAGLAALDIARIEAGFLLADIDYVSSRKALIEAQKSSPFEAGLGWTVKFDKGDFVGRRVLLQEQAKGSWALVGLEAEWSSLEQLFSDAGLPPLVAGRASREGVPLYDGRRQVGRATSRTFSPILKRYLALATVEKKYAAPGTALSMEVTVEYVRHTVPVRVVKTPFYDPPRKRA